VSDAIIFFSFEFKHGCCLAINLEDGMPCSLALAHLYLSSGAECGLEMRCEELRKSENRNAPVGHYSCTVPVKEVKQMVFCQGLGSPSANASSCCSSDCTCSSSGGQICRRRSTVLPSVHKLEICRR
jgi:hypothetical protein